MNRLIVVALGGNALSSVASVAGYDDERHSVQRAAAELVSCGEPDDRFVIVHGNGPQVGRLLQNAQGPDDLDVCVAQTQGEIGYLLVNALQHVGLRAVAIVTRAVVSGSASGLPATKAVGPVLAQRPDGSARSRDGGWQVTVPSPEPERIVELDAVRSLLSSYHLVVGGGGGVPVTQAGEAVACVIDKDWTAAMLAIELQADALIFVTNTEGVRDAHDRLVTDLSCAEAAELVESGVAQEGSMGPKLESARRFAQSRGRQALIAQLGEVRAGMAGNSGTRILPPTMTRPPSASQAT